MPWDKQFDVDETLTRAMEAFWARGYEATSMQDLVQCTGVNRASLYATYGDKRALFLAALHQYDQKVRKAMLAQLEHRYPPREAIRRLFLAFAEQPAVDGVRRGCLLSNTALELAAHDEEVRAVVAAGQQDMEGFFRRMIERGQADGSIPAGIEPDSAAKGLLAALLGLVVLVRSRPDPALLAAVARQAMRQIA
jgi:TetR/AcrR family transcriptional repressor of nem operon